MHCSSASLFWSICSGYDGRRCSTMYVGNHRVLYDACQPSPIFSQSLLWIDGAYITLFILWRKNILFVKLRNASHNYRADVTHTHIEYTCAQSKVRPAPSNGQVKVQLNIVENTLGLIIFEERKHICV